MRHHHPHFRQLPCDGTPIAFNALVIMTLDTQPDP
jgi:hypothetical protein